MFKEPFDLFAIADLGIEDRMSALAGEGPPATTPGRRPAKAKLATASRADKNRALKASEALPDLFSEPEAEPPAKPSTIGEMIKMIEGDLSLPQKRRRDWKSGLTTLLRVTETSTNLPATAATLRELVRKMEQSPGGLNRNRRRNLRSCIKAAACYCDVIPDRPTPADLNDGWCALKEAAPVSSCPRGWRISIGITLMIIAPADR